MSTLVNHGATLVELMLIIVIVALLAALAYISYSSYMNKAKAKDLITLARACAHEALAECMVHEDGTVDWSALASCNMTQQSFGPYLINATVYTPSGTTSCTNLSSANITACGYISSIPAHYRVTCSFDAEKNLSCSLIMVSGCPR